MAPTPQCPTRVARKLLKLTGIPVSRRTSFHANQARRKVCKEPKDLSSTNTPADHHCAIRINIVNLKHRLRYIDPDRANLADGRPHSTWLRFDATIQWQFDAADWARSTASFATKAVNGHRSWMFASIRMRPKLCGNAICRSGPLSDLCNARKRRTSMNDLTTNRPAAF